MPAKVSSTGMTKALFPDILDVHVTAEDIAEAGGGVHQCPMAKAIRREHRGWRVSASYNGVTVHSRRGGQVTYRTTTRARRFMQRYDYANQRQAPRWKPVKPQGFQLMRAKS